MKETMQKNPATEAEVAKGVSRRRFLTYAGMMAGAGILIDSCKKEDEPSTLPGTINLGTSDIAIQNYAYILEQMSAAFYIEVCTAKNSPLEYQEMLFFQNLRDHEIAHREFLKNYMGKNAIEQLTFNFSSIDFTNRDKIYGSAQTFEDLCVAAYNGVAQSVTNPEFLIVVGQIASVESRHAAAISDKIKFGSFADTADSNGLDKSLTPNEVLASIKTFLKVNVTINV